MRKISFLMVVMLGCAVTPAQALVGGGGMHRHGSPASVNPTTQFVCKPRDGRGTCTTVPYARLGAPCTCDGPRKGIVSTR